MKKRAKGLMGMLLCCGMLSTSAAGMELSDMEAYQGELQITLEETNIPAFEMFSGLGVSLAVREDGALAELAGAVAGRGSNLFTGRIILDGEEVLMLLPELTEKVFSLNLLEYGEMVTGLAQEGLDSAAGGTEPSLNPFDLKDDGETDGSGLADSEPSWSLDLTGVDLEAIGERYIEYCGSAFESLGENIVLEDLEPAEFTIDGETVSCEGSAATIEEADLLLIVDATVDFLVTDEECRGLLQELLGEEADLSDRQVRTELRRSAYQEAAQAMSDLYMEYYETPWGETAAFYTEMPAQGEEESGFTMLYRNKGGAESGDNFDWHYTLTSGGEVGELYFSRTIQREEDETVYDLYGETALPDTPTASFSCTLSCDSLTGDYALSLGTYLDDVTQTTVSSYGSCTESSTGAVLSCDSLTLMSGTDYIRLSGSLSMGRLSGGISYEADPENRLDLLDEDDQLLLEEEGEQMALRAQQILISYFLQNNPELFMETETE